MYIKSFVANIILEDILFHIIVYVLRDSTV